MPKLSDGVSVDVEAAISSIHEILGCYDYKCLLENCMELPDGLPLAGKKAFWLDKRGRYVILEII